MSAILSSGKEAGAPNASPAYKISLRCVQPARWGEEIYIIDENVDLTHLLRSGGNCGIDRIIVRNVGSPVDYLTIGMC